MGPRHLFDIFPKPGIQRPAVPWGEADPTIVPHRGFEDVTKHFQMEVRRLFHIRGIEAILADISPVLVGQGDDFLLPPAKDAFINI
jgi:hypothetical protein